MACPKPKDFPHQTEAEKDAYAEYVQAWRDYVPCMTVEELPEVILFATEGRMADEKELTDAILKRGHRLTIVRKMEKLFKEFDQDAPTGKIVICDEASTYRDKGIEGYREFLLTYGRSLMKHRMKLVVLRPPREEQQGFLSYGHVVFASCFFPGAIEALQRFWDRLVYPEYIDACGEPHPAEV